MNKKVSIFNVFKIEIPFNWSTLNTSKNNFLEVWISVVIPLLSYNSMINFIFTANFIEQHIYEYYIFVEIKKTIIKC